MTPLTFFAYGAAFAASLALVLLVLGLGLCVYLVIVGAAGKARQ